MTEQASRREAGRLAGPINVLKPESTRNAPADDRVGFSLITARETTTMGRLGDAGKDLKGLGWR